MKIRFNLVLSKGTFPNTTTSNNKTCSKCSGAIQDCDFCLNASFCTTCASNRYRYTTQTKCEVSCSGDPSN